MNDTGRSATEHLPFAICHLTSRYNATRANPPPPTVRERQRAVADPLPGDGGVVGAELSRQRLRVLHISWHHKVGALAQPRQAQRLPWPRTVLNCASGRLDAP